MLDFAINTQNTKVILKDSIKINSTLKIIFAIQPGNLKFFAIKLLINALFTG